MRGVARRLYQEYIQHRRRKRCRVSGRGLRDERALHSQSNPLGVENMCFLVFFQPWKYATVNPIPGIPFIISPSFFQKSFSLPFLHTHTHTLIWSFFIPFLSLTFHFSHMWNVNVCLWYMLLCVCVSPIQDSVGNNTTLRWLCGVCVRCICVVIRV